MRNTAVKLNWYANRLRAMGPEEIVHRIGEAVRRRADGRRSYGWGAFVVPASPIPSLAFVQHPQTADAECLARWRKAAETLDTGLELLGQHWPAGNEPEAWHRDPVSGRTWPRDQYCFDISCRGIPGFGDIKYVFERNRLQYLVPIAAAAAATDDAALAERCWAEIDAWIAANPPFDGVNWYSGIELALRVVSILAVAGLLGTTDFDPARAGRLRACLAAHAAWLARYPSLHSSANNHLVAEAAGLFLIGTLAPDLPDAGRHADAGRRILIEEAENQIHLDGVGAEQSPTYTAFTLEWLVLCARVAEQVGQPFPRRVGERFAAAAEHLAWMTDEGGHQPRIGDDDEGRVLIDGSGREPGYVTHMLGVLAGHLGRPELAVAASAPLVRNLFLAAAPPAVTAAPSGTRTFDVGGYTLDRRVMAGRNALLVLDHGPLGHLSIAAHGHADALAVWLHLDGRPLLIDAGTYMYGSGGAARDGFRVTAAHNTPLLGTHSTSDPAGAFNWKRKARAWRLPSSDGTIVARHDGYAAAFGVHCERAVTVGDSAAITIVDRLVAVDAKAVGLPPLRIGWLVDRGCTVHLDGETATIARDGIPVLAITAGPGLTATLEIAELSPAFGERVETTRIVFTASMPATDMAYSSTLFVLSAPA